MLEEGVKKKAVVNVITAADVGSDHPRGGHMRCRPVVSDGLSQSSASSALGPAPPLKTARQRSA